jgi:hypothetical protein
MNPKTDSDRFSKTVCALALTFNREATEMLISAYWMALSDLDIKSIEAASITAMRQCRFMPTPSELRDLAGVGNSARSIAAWSDVQRAMPLGSYKSIDFADPLINAVVRLLDGWPALLDRCGTVDGAKWYRMEFSKLYEQLSTSGVDGEVCRPLKGIAEIQVANGQVVPVIPVVIDTDAARIALSREKVRGRIGLRPVGEGSIIPKVEFKRA